MIYSHNFGGMMFYIEVGGIRVKIESVVAEKIIKKFAFVALDTRTALLLS